MSQSFHTSTQDVQPRREEEEEEEEAARRGADGVRDWKRRPVSEDPGLKASCAGGAMRGAGMVSVARQSFRSSESDPDDALENART